MTPEPILQADIGCGESPTWSAEDQALYFTDIPGRTLHRLDPATGAHRTWPMPEELCAFAFREAGGLVAAMRSGFAHIDLDTAAVDYVAKPEADKPENRLNDGRCDRQGRFWAGSMNEPRTAFDGTLYRLDNGECTAMAGDVIVANGLAFSPDSRTMYWSDSRSSKIFAFDFDAATGDISNRRLFFQTTERQGRPDGATVDIDGYYWSACFRGHRILRIAPDGTVDHEIEMPVRDITMVAFGGENYGTLFVTTASEALTPQERADSPLAGAIFALDPGTRGLAEPKYRG